MSLPSSLLAYGPQLTFMETALDLPRGARMFFNTEAEAEHWRMRCNMARSLDRKENEKIYEVGDKMHGKSQFDVLMFTIRHSPDGVWCYAEIQILDESRVEPIPETEYTPLIEATEILAIEDKTNDNETSI